MSYRSEKDDPWDTVWNEEQHRYETIWKVPVQDTPRPTGNPGPFGMDEEDD